MWLIALQWQRVGTATTKMPIRRFTYVAVMQLLRLGDQPVHKTVL